MTAGGHPRLIATVLDAVDPRELAEFYRELLGWTYRPGDEPADERPGTTPPPWLVLMDPTGQPRLAVQKVASLNRPTWPDGEVHQQAHLDFRVDNDVALGEQHTRAIALGATLLEDRSTAEEEHLNVYADPAGHPFCLIVVDPEAWAALVPDP